MYWLEYVALWNVNVGVFAYMSLEDEVVVLRPEKVPKRQWMRNGGWKLRGFRSSYLARHTPHCRSNPNQSSYRTPADAKTLLPVVDP